jgi:adenylate kinase family enzyme
MKRVAIFGNAGGGKSTLARELAAITGLPLHVVDMLEFRPGGAAVPQEEYLRAHSALIAAEEWIIDGYGGKTVWERLDAADTLIHVDLPLAVHAIGVTKRLVKGLFAPPQGWPEGSPLIASSLSSYRVLWPCNKHLTPKYRSYVSRAAAGKRIVHLRSRPQIEDFLEATKRAVSSARSNAAQ